tara:strand:+ start:1484 stop:3607 length:2124 start_codon:yes stop_codon:yes gene_type:complete
MAIEFLNSVDFNQNQLIAPVIENLGTEPGSPEEGQMYYNNTGGSTDMYFWNGSAFVSMTGGMSNWILRDDTGSASDVTISDGVFVTFAAQTGALGTSLSGAGTTANPYKMTITSPNTEYSVATSSALGLVKLGSDTEQSTAGNTVTSTASRSYKIQLNSSNQMLVNVPWTDTNTEYSMMTSSVLGLGKLFSDTQQDTAANSVTSTASRTYGIQANSSDQLVVNVPWTDTNTEYSAATSSTLGLMKLFSDTQQDTAANAVTSTASRTYGIQFNSDDQAVVNVPWSDTNTQNTYVLDKAAGSTDLILSKNGSTQDTITFSGTSNEVTVTGTSEDAYVFGLPDDVTITGELTVSGTGQSSFGGQVTVPATPSASTDAASKGYVDGLVSGGLTFKGTFRADTGEILSGTNDGSYLYQLTGTAFDPSAARVAVAVGDYYVVANTGGNFYGDGGTGTCSPTTFLDVGDAVIGVEAAAVNTSICADWSLVSQGVVVNSVTTTDGTYINLTPNSATTGAVTVTADLSASNGTSDTSTRFLSKDNTWDVPSYTTNTDETYDLNATQDGSNVDLNLTSTSGSDDSVVQLTAGSNITLTRNSATEVTIASTDTGALGVSILLNSSLAYVSKASAGGLTTFAVNVANSNVFGAGKTAVNVKCEVIDAATSGANAGQTVFADVVRGIDGGGATYGAASLNIAFAGTVADSAYRVLLTYVG